MVKRTEKETVITFNEIENTVHIYTSQKGVAGKLRRRGFKLVKVDTVNGRIVSWEYVGLKKQISFRRAKTHDNKEKNEAEVNTISKQEKQETGSNEPENKAKYEYKG